MRLGGKVKLKLEDGTKLRGVIVGWLHDTATVGGPGEMVPGRTMTTLQIVVEELPEEIIR